MARFERGVDPELPPVASARAAELMEELAGGSTAPGFVDEHPRPRPDVKVSLPVGEPERLLGVAVSAEESAAFLERLGFGVETGGGVIEATVPSYRPDVTRAADLVEEVARMRGYETFPSTVPFGTGGFLPEWLQRERTVRRLMSGFGFFEVWNYDFIGFADIERLGLPAGDPRLETVEVRNPLSEEEGHLRSTLLPGLLAGLALNESRNLPDPRLFEIGAVFLPSEGEIPEQPHRLGFAAAGLSPGSLWEERRAVDGRDAVGIVRALLETLHLPYTLVQEPVAGFHPGRAARVLVDGEDAGVAGEIHPEAAERFGVSGRVAAGELSMELLAPRLREFTAPSTFPPLVLDMAFDLPQEAAVGELMAIVGRVAGEILEKSQVFDVFSGPPLDEGRKSVALRLTFRHRERTLQDEELAPVRESIAAAVSTALGGRLRGG